MMKLLLTLLGLMVAAQIPAAEPHWAFQPVRRPAVPVSPESHNPIDGFLLAELRKHDLHFAAPTDKATLLRRVTLDLIGVPPTRDELHSFVNDRSPDAYEKVVDRLLNDPRHGERWARHWMDVWRYSDWYGRRSVPDVMNSYPQIWRWRDWIVRSLNQDRGYDRMILEMLAADEICPDDDQNIVATGFLVRNWFKWNYQQWMRDNVEHVGKAFLGLTFNCCHCHDHKYDPITQEEYFRFRAFFEPLELRHDRVAGEPDPGPFKKYVYAESYGPIKSGAIRVFDEKLDAATYSYSGGDERNKVAGKPAVTPGAPKFLGGDKLKVNPVNLPPTAWYPGVKDFVQREELAKREAALSAAESELAKLQNKPRLRLWSSIVGPVDVLAAEAEANRARSDLAAIKARIAADRVVHLGEPGDALALSCAASHAERRHLFDAAVAARAKLGLQIAQAPKDQRPKLQAQLPASESTIAQARAKLAKESAAYTPLSPQYPKTSTGRRAALAKWIASPENPLTARVAVNHLWGWHFGRPIVESTFDFGRKGTKPSHPQLLDWLASELAANGWKLKPLQRLIVMSAAYRQSSRSSSNSTDPDNRLLSRFPTLRMEAEVVRDSLLAASGDLDSTLGGPEIPHEQGQLSKRRSMYFAHHGESKMAWLEIFDAANACDCYRRSTSVMPQQALALSNSDLAVHCGQALTRRLVSIKDNATFVTATFETILGRPPSSAEAGAAREFLAAGSNSRELLIHGLFNHNDFVTIR